MNNIIYSNEWIELRKVFLDFIKSKDYKSIVNFNINKSIEYIKKLEGEELIHYNLLVGASYQELGQLEKADVYFDYYLGLVDKDTVNSFLNKKGLENTEKLDDRTKCFMLMCFELEGLGLKYKNT